MEPTLRRGRIVPMLN